MDISFSGKTALVTGAGKGIGRELVIALSKAGARVFALSRTQADLDSLKEEHPKLDTICCDVTDSERLEEALSGIGPVDLLVNNAAVAKIAPILETPLADFDLMFSANVRQVLHVTQIVARGMVKRGDAASHGCAVVNVSSQAGARALRDHTVYSATKAALDSFTRSMALELGEQGIRVNSVQPTVTWTAMAAVGWSDPQKSADMKSKIPLARFAEVSEVVNCILFLLSDKASMVNGVCMPIDGGFLAC